MQNDLLLKKQRLFSLLLALFCPLFLLAQQPFVTIWNTENPGETADDQIYFTGYGTYDYYWENFYDASINGSGSAENSKIFTFPEPGVYRLEITPSGANPFHRIRFDDLETYEYNPDHIKIVGLVQWGDVVWSTMKYAFSETSNLEIIATDIPNLSNVTSMKGIFFNSWVGSIPNLNNWDVSKVTDMSEMFFFNIFFNEYINDWDVSTVEDMSNMFTGAYTFNQPIGNWDTGQVTNMNGMFSEAKNFNQPIGNWNVSSVTNMNNMFAWASNFNQPIGDWDVSNVTTMGAMFARAYKFNQPIGDWDVSKVKSMYRMFSEAWDFNQQLESWEVNQVESMGEMFYFAKEFNQELSNWNVSNVENMGSMFEKASAFDQDLGNWKLNNIIHNTNNEITGLVSMFDLSGMSCDNYSLTLKGWVSNEDLSENIILGAEDIGYSPDANQYRNYLINNLGWEIQGDVEGDCTMGMDELNTIEINLYPNPSTDFVNLNGLNGNESIQIYDNNGKLIRQSKNTDQETTIDVSNLIPGVYHLLIKTSDGRRIKKQLIKK